MPNYRRNRVPGGSYFLTVVTYQRKNIFAEEFARVLFWDVLIYEKIPLSKQRLLFATRSFPLYLDSTGR